MTIDIDTAAFAYARVAGEDDTDDAFRAGFEAASLPEADEALLDAVTRDGPYRATYIRTDAAGVVIELAGPGILPVTVTLRSALERDDLLAAFAALGGARRRIARASRSRADALAYTWRALRAAWRDRK